MQIYNFLLYGYVTIKKDLRTYSINPLYLIFDKINGYYEEINGNKYLTLVPSNKSKNKIKKYERLWIKIKDLMRLITKNSDNHDEKYMNQIWFRGQLPIMVIAVRAAFHENKNFYPEAFLDECLYKI